MGRSEFNLLDKSEKISETSYKVVVAGQELYYRVAGDGLPVVFFHGYGHSGYVWQPCLPYLAHRRKVILVDLPGYGRSKLAGPWRLHEVASLLATWLRGLELPPIALVGHSMGGSIAIHLTAHASELVERL